MEFHPISHRIPEPYHHEDWCEINQCNRWQKPILFLSFLFLKTDLLLEVGMLHDLVQSRSNLRVQHFEKSGNSFQKLIANTSIPPSTESTISTSLIHNSAPEGKSEQVVTWFLNLIIRYKHDDGVGNLSHWSSDICCLCCKKLMVADFQQMSALGLRFQFVLPLLPQVSLCL